MPDMRQPCMQNVRERELRTVPALLWQTLQNKLKMQLKIRCGARKFLRAPHLNIVFESKVVIFEPFEPLAPLSGAFFIALGVVVVCAQRY